MNGVLLRALSAERLKLRRTPVLLATIGAPLCVALLAFAEKASPQAAQFWPGVMKITLTAWAIFMLPLLITLLTSLVAGLEHNNHAWKHLLALPAPRWAVFLAKFVAVAVLVLIATAVTMLGLFAVGYAKLAMNPALVGVPSPPVGTILIASGKLWMASWLVIALQSWVALRCAHFAIPIGVGIMGTFFSLFAAGSEYGLYFPWLQAWHATNPERWLHAAWLGCVGGVAATVLACVDLSAREEGDRSLPGPRVIAAAAGLALCFAGGGYAIAHWHQWESIERRMARVENTLIPSVKVKGGADTHRLRDRMAHYQVPGMSIAVMRDGRVAWARGYGSADAKTGRPVTPDTLFQAASISKPVTATAVLRAAEQGHFMLDEDVNTFLRTWKVPESPLTTKNKVTVRRLLSHTAGVDEHRVEGYKPDQPIPTTLQVLDGLAPSIYPAIRVVAEPGSKFGYSGGGYVILQHLLSETRSDRFAEIVRSSVFDPLAMRHSTFDLPSEWEDLAASGHGIDGVTMPERWRVHPELAPNGLWTTPTDLGLFACELLRCFRGESTTLLEQASAKAMLTKVQGLMGLGIMITGKERAMFFMHEGASVGYRASMVMNMQTGEGVVVMTNADRGGNLMHEVVRAIAHEFNWAAFKSTERESVAVDPAVFAGYVGVYRIAAADNAEVRITTRNSKLYLQTATLGPEPVEMLALGSHRFFILEDEGDIVFEVDAGGRAKAFVSEFGGEFLRAQLAE